MCLGVVSVNLLIEFHVIQPFEFWEDHVDLFLTTILVCFVIVAYNVISIGIRQRRDLNTQLNAIDTATVITVMNLDGTIVSANKNFSELVRLSKTEILGMNYLRFIPEFIKSQDGYKLPWEGLEPGQTAQGEFELVDKFGNPIWIQASYVVTASPAPGIPMRVFSIGTDRTTEHLNITEIARKNSYLEYAAKILRHDMHSGINTYIPRGVKALKRRLTDERIRELHLETPLKLICGGLEHAQRVYQGVREFSNLVKENADLEKSVHNLYNLLTNCVKGTIYADQVHIDMDLPAATVNEPLFCTAVDNLIRNGLLYNDSQDKRVSIYMVGDELCIHDNGRGMTQADLEYLSRPYTRRPNQSERGTGLGLNICMAILKEHGFTLRAEKMNPGTRMMIKLKGAE